MKHADDRLERAKRVLAGVRGELELAGDLSTRTEDEVKKLGEALAEYGAMLIDITDGRPYTPTGTKLSARSMLKKVRRALGYTSP
jgi:hypothetical protein